MAGQTLRATMAGDRKCGGSGYGESDDDECWRDARLVAGLEPD